MLKSEKVFWAFPFLEGIRMKIPEILIKKAEELEVYYQEHYPQAAPLVRQCFFKHD